MVFLVYFYILWQRSLDRQALLRDSQVPVQYGTYMEDADANLSTVGDDAIDQESPVCSGDVFLFALPAGLDLLGTTIAGVGLYYTSASIWQMLRGSLVLFTALLSVFYRGRTLHGYHYVGLSSTIIGLLLVGLASVFEAGTKGNAQGGMVFGIFLVILGQMCSAVQMIVEETFLQDKNFHPTRVVGMEGCWGFMMMSITLVGLYHVPKPSDPTSILTVFHDDAPQAWHMAMVNHRIFYFGGMYLGSIGTYNFCGLGVTKSLTAVHRTLVDAMRITVVWTAEVVIYYVIERQYGEPVSINSLYQLCGFVFLIFGNLVYNNVLVLPCESMYPPPEFPPSVQHCDSTSVQDYKRMGLGTPIPDTTTQNTGR